jgi:hypothetical protein
MIEHIPEVRIELRPSQIDIGGVGTFAVHRIEKGQKAADGVAEEDFQELVSWECFPRLSVDLQRKVMAFCVGTPEGFVPPPCFDFNKLSLEWYLNHSCEGNCGFDNEGDFVAIRNIQKGEELTYDYSLIESNPNFSMKCSCGSKTCRHLVTGNDWKDEKFVLKNREYMHPRLRRLTPVPA